MTVACVLTFTHLPPEAMPRSLPGLLEANGADKIEHALAYATIMMSFLFAMRGRLNWRAWIIIILAVAAAGGTDELTQPFANRDCSGWDWMADLIGITLASLVFVLRRNHAKAPKQALEPPPG